MRLLEVKLENFRLLKTVSVQLEQSKSTTVLVGPNNSGKTSLAEALKLFSEGASRAFSVSDFSILTHPDFVKFEQSDVALDESAEKSLPPLPSMSLTMVFQYEETPEDLVVANDVLMDLDAQSFRVAVKIILAVKDRVLLAKAFRAYREKTKGSLIEFLALNLPAHYDVSVYKMHPATGATEILSDSSVLERLFKIDFLPAQRHMEDQEAGTQAILMRTPAALERRLSACA